jgi:hypothetical protein
MVLGFNIWSEVAVPIHWLSPDWMDSERKKDFKQRFVLCIYLSVIDVIGISYVRLRDQKRKSMEEKNPIYLRSSPPSAMRICFVEL